MLNMNDRQVVSTAAPGVPGLAAGVVQPAVTLSQRTDAVLRGLDFVLKHHGAAKLIREELFKQVHSALDSSIDEKVWLKRMKFVLTYPLAKYLRNPLPASPDVAFKPSGALRCWMKQRLCCFSRKNTHLWYSWLQSKRSSLPASDSLIEETYEKHFETLTKEDPGDDETIDKIMSIPCFKKLLKRLRKEVARKMKDVDFLESTPSGNASFESTRKIGGQQGVLVDRSQREDKYTVDEEFFLQCKLDTSHEDIYEKCLLSSDRLDPEVMVYHPSERAYRKLFRPEVATIPVPDELCTMFDINRTYSSNRPVEFSVKEGRIPYGYDDWQTLKNHVSKQLKERPINCCIQGVVEPMKVRVISKGEALPYYICKPLQRAIHDVLRDIPCFRLIGRPFCPTDLIDIAKNSEPDYKWFSIDYSAATDGLSMKYSSRIFEKVIKDLDDDLKVIARRVIGPHSLWYPDVAGVMPDELRGVQTNGQLMGSILSFPFLCLANLGVYLLNTQVLHYGWSDKKRLQSVLINGDDMVYAAPEELWAPHCQYSNNVGLEMSLGKAYCHSVYANVNSTSVHYDLGSKTAQPWQIDFLNVGLIYGQHKVQKKVNDGSSKGKLRKGGVTYEDGERSQFRENGSRDKHYATRWRSPLIQDEDLSKLIKRMTDTVTDESQYLVPTINVILRGTLPGKQKEVLKIFLSMHHAEIAQECFGLCSKRGRVTLFTRNLFLPCSIGGMGVERPSNFKFKIEKIQKAVAISMENQLQLNGTLLSSDFPAPGVEVAETKVTSSVPWIRKVSEPRMFGGKIGESLIKHFKKFELPRVIVYDRMNYPEEEFMITGPMCDYYDEEPLGGAPAW